MLRTVLVLAGVLVALAVQPAAAETAIGSVTRLQGTASFEKDGATGVLGGGSSVFLNEKVSTAEAARLELTFTDGTRLTLGEKAEMTLDRFVYKPADGEGELKLAVVGAFRFVTGQVSKQRNRQVAVTTPVATIGIRGTEFFGGPIDGRPLGVFLIDGAVTVTNAQGEVVLDSPGQGTDITQPGAAPGAVTFWPQDKIDRALSSVSFQ